MHRKPRSVGAGAAGGRIVLTAALALVAASPLAAWSPTTQVSIARTAARLAPPDLARQIEHRADRFRDGVLAPFQEGAPERHYRNRDRGTPRRRNVRGRSVMTYPSSWIGLSCGL